MLVIGIRIIAFDKRLISLTRINMDAARNFCWKITDTRVPKITTRVRMRNLHENNISINELIIRCLPMVDLMTSTNIINYNGDTVSRCRSSSESNKYLLSKLYGCHVREISERIASSVVFLDWKRTFKVRFAYTPDSYALTMKYSSFLLLVAIRICVKDGTRGQPL